MKSIVQTLFKFTILSLSLLLILGSCNNDSTTIESYDQKKIIHLVQRQMAEQEVCWNQGDIECFMEHYWHSDSLLFIGKSGLSYGWQTTLNNYKKSYPDVKAMGKLQFTNEIVEFVDNATIRVIGQWQLTRSEGLEDLEGYYSLLWQKKDGNWVIITDHSS